jgi:MSHA pilin protein MshC
MVTDMDIPTVKKYSGFTLIEMVMVIMVIAILSIVVINQLPAASINIGAEAQIMINNLRYTQALAMYTGQSYYLTAASGSSYEIVNAGGTASVLAQGNTVRTFPTGVSFGPTNFPNGLVGFNSHGQPTTDTSGTLLTTVGTLSLTNGTTTMTITVQPETGRLTLS